MDNNLFEMYGNVFDSSNPRFSMGKDSVEADLVKMIHDGQEDKLSPFACKSSKSRGRKVYEEPCVIRTCFERDMGRIIYSQAFRRLRHKTQVFFSPQNDHICSRIEHVIYVNYISTIIARALNLNVELTQAIALGHDIGHAPFGHTGERALSNCMKQVDENLFFKHENQSLRVLDVLEQRSGKNGLNLTFEVRDGIVCHCGETYNEKSLVPLRCKEMDSIEKMKAKEFTPPATLEGCIVRFADKISYVGRDVEDAYRAGLVDKEIFDKDITKILGNTNSDVINTLVGDIIVSSLDKDEIKLSDDIAWAFSEMLKTNVDAIYRAKTLNVYEETVNIKIKALFDTFMECGTDYEKAISSNNSVVAKFGHYALAHPDVKGGNFTQAVIVADYIAGMTDIFCSDCFEELYRV